MNDALEQLERAVGLSISHFFISAVGDVMNALIVLVGCHWDSWSIGFTFNF